MTEKENEKENEKGTQLLFEVIKNTRLGGMHVSFYR